MNRQRTETICGHIVFGEGECTLPHGHAEAHQPFNPNEEALDYPVAALRTIADTSRFDAPTEARDTDAATALDAIRVLPLAERAKLIAWLLGGEL